MADPRIRYVSNDENLGITENYARCLELASGELMMFLGCDDLMHPDFVVDGARRHRRFPDAAMIQVGVRVIDEHGGAVDPLVDRSSARSCRAVDGRTELGGEPLAVSLLRGNWLYWPSLVFRTDGAPAATVPRRPADHPGPRPLIDMVIAGEMLVLEPTVCFSYRRHRRARPPPACCTHRLPDERRYYDSAAAELRDGAGAVQPGRPGSG